ncbi:MAG: hypothetical protein WDN31_02300 [Hyphomicrobium sp.]
MLLLIGAGVFVLTQGTTRDIGAGMVRASQALMGSAGSFLSGLKTATAQNAQPSFVAEFEAIQAQIRGGADPLPAAPVARPAGVRIGVEPAGGGGGAGRGSAGSRCPRRS